MSTVLFWVDRTAESRKKWHEKLISAPMALPAIHSKAEVLLLFIHCLLLIP